MLSFVTGALNPCVTDVTGRTGTELAELCISCGVHVISTLPGPAGCTQLWDSLGPWFFPCRGHFPVGKRATSAGLEQQSEAILYSFLGSR